MRDVEELGVGRHFFHQIAEAAGIGIIQRGVHFIQQTERCRVEAEQSKDQAHGGECFFTAGEQVDGAVLLAGRPGHDGDTGGEQVVADHLQIGFAAAEKCGEETVHALIYRIEGFFKARFGFVVNLGDGLFQQINCRLDIFVLAAVISVAFARFVQLL